MLEKLSQYIDSLDTNKVEQDRQQKLDQVTAYLKSSKNPKLNFICTHNSRRSHLGQVWAQTMADRFGVKVECFSGGTEATAFHPNAVAALSSAGFDIAMEAGSNPKYSLTYAEDAKPIVCFSKTYDDPYNPSEKFAAIMTCVDADEACPIVRGAESRISLPYVDPKVSDGRPEEVATYDARCREIATEMLVVFSAFK